MSLTIMKKVVATSAVLIVLTAGYLVSQNAAAPSEAPKALKTAPLNEIEYLKLENLVLKQELTSRSLQEVQKEFGSSLSEICKSHGVEVCRFDLPNKSIVEIKK